MLSVGAPKRKRSHSNRLFTVSWHLEEDDDANGEFEINLEYLVIDGETNTLISNTSNVDATESSTVLPPSFLPAVRPSETIPIGMLMHAIKDGQWTDPHARKILLVGRTQEPDTVTIIAPATMAAGETTTAGTDIALKTPAPNNVSEEANEVQEDEAGSGGLSTGAKAGIGTGVGAAVVLFIAAVWVYLTRLRSEVTAPGVKG
ncbi:uncharacterized protein BDW70DRAFT_81095 [Aspergillus foveolatus]|uniref:uncharacterized protein n=1 Tax=Aspergillus foveolatus TaxID=210207 RepID=UPI003CCD86ED